MKNDDRVFTHGVVLVNGPFCDHSQKPLHCLKQFAHTLLHWVRLIYTALDFLLGLAGDLILEDELILK